MGVEDAATRSALPPADGAERGSTRLALIDPPAARTTLDGAWWPRTRDLTQELPALVEELHRRGIRVTRVTYNPDLWGPAPRRLDADGRTIRLGWFRNLDRQLLNMTGDSSRTADADPTTPLPAGGLVHGHNERPSPIEHPPSTVGAVLG